MNSKATVSSTNHAQRACIPFTIKNYVTIKRIKCINVYSSPLFPFLTSLFSLSSSQVGLFPSFASPKMPVSYHKETLTLVG